MLFSLPETVIENIESLTKKEKTCQFLCVVYYIPPSSVEFVFKLFIFSVASIFCPILQIKRIFRILFKS